MWHREMERAYYQEIGGGEVVEGNMSCHDVLMLDQEMDNISIKM